MALVSFNEVFDEMIKDPEFKQEYDALAPEFELKKQLVKARVESNLTQTEIAKKMGVKQSNLARFEQQTTDVKLSTIIKYAKALGMTELKISLS